MTEGFIDACLKTLARAGDDAASANLICGHAREVLRRPTEAAILVRRVLESRAVQDDGAQRLFEAVLDEARMARENHAPEGAVVFDAVEAAVKELVEEDRLDPDGRMLLAQSYARIGLEPPANVMLRFEDIYPIGEDASVPDGVPPDTDKFLDDIIRETGQDPLRAHDLIAQVGAAFPPPARGVFTAAIVSGDRPLATRLGTYWLLDRVPEVRFAVAEAFRVRAREGRIDAAVLARLIAVRKWLPPEPARAILDDAVKIALRREVTGGAVPAKWTIHRVLASLPDGAGAQNIAAAVQQGGKRGVAMLLLKQGHGVKDAFVVPCASASEQKRTMAGIESQMDVIEVDASFVPKALGWALGDGAAAGVLPTPGLVDMAEIWDAEDMVPAAFGPASIIAAIDTDNVAAALSPAKLTRLVSDSRSWHSKFGLTQSWFEDSAEVRDLLDRHQTERAAATALWRYLDGRREWWATMFARAAATLNAATKAPPDVWLSFAATARSLIEGRPLKKIPIMEAIVLQSLAAGDARAFEMLRAGGDDDSSDRFVPLGGAPSGPERPGEFARLIEGSGLSPAWFDGLLAAVSTAPVFVSPTEWVNPLLQRIPFADIAALNRFLELLMTRANHFVDISSGAERVAAKLAGFDAAERRDWAAGFSALVKNVKKAWPARALAADDKRILKSLAQAAEAGIDDELARLLPAWIDRRYTLRG